MTRIETARLVLRPPRMSDAEVITALIGNWNVARWLARVPHPYAAADAGEFLVRLRDRSGTDELTLAIEIDARLAGIAGLNRHNNGLHLGYWLGELYWGRGIVTEAARAIVGYHYRRSNDDVLHSGYFAGNGASARVLAKLGFEPCGERSILNRAHGRELPHVSLRLDRARFQALHP